LVSEGKDPIEVRNGQRLDAQIKARRAKTLGEVAKEYWEMRSNGLAPNTMKVARRILRDYIVTPMGDIPIQKIDTGVIVEKTKIDYDQRSGNVARVRSDLRRIFEYAIHKGYFHSPNPAAPSALKYALPARKPKTKHRKALDFRHVGRFVEYLRNMRIRPDLNDRTSEKQRSPIALIVEFVILTGVRSGEARLARWKEIDIKEMLWRVPPENRKTGNLTGAVRSIPITKPMLAILEEMQTRRKSQSPEAMIFPRPTRDKPFDAPYVALDLKRLLKKKGSPLWPLEDGTQGIPHLHGFRSTLRSWARANRFPDDYWAITVDHLIGDSTSQSYGHDRLIEERRDMMEKWAEYCSRPAPEPQTNKELVINLAERRR